MAYQGKFWKGEIKTTKGRDTIRGNPEAPPMHGGPGDMDDSMPDGADSPNRGSSQPKAKGGGSDELPMMSQVKKRKQVLRAHALRVSANGTTTAAIGGGAAGGGAGE